MLNSRNQYLQRKTIAMTRPGQLSRFGQSQTLKSNAEAHAVRALVWWGVLSFVTIGTLTLLSVTV